MISSNRLGVSGLTAAAMTLLPGSSKAQTMARSFEQLQERIPRAEETVVVIYKTGQETSDRIAGVSFRSSEAVTGPDSFRPTTMPRGWFKRVIDREASRLNLSAPFADSALLVVQQPGPEKQSWIGRGHRRQLLPLLELPAILASKRRQLSSRFDCACGARSGIKSVRKRRLMSRSRSSAFERRFHRLVATLVAIGHSGETAELAWAIIP